MLAATAARLTLGEFGGPDLEGSQNVAPARGAIEGIRRGRGLLAGQLRATLSYASSKRPKATTLLTKKAQPREWRVRAEVFAQPKERLMAGQN